MRVPVNWLNEYCDAGLPPAKLAERLAMTGTEVDRVLSHGVGSPDAFVVGKVLTADRHPDADRLTVCAVDVGEDAPAQIVCGAPNVAAGQTVAVARPGAVMPDGTKLGRAKLRGVESAGMILAEDEVAIGTDHAGIMVLPEGPPPGSPLAAVLPIQTDVLGLEITPNRPDCLGIYGVAREVHAATGAELAAPPWAEDPFPQGPPPPGIEIVVEAADLCPRFTARAFEDVTIGPSPEWLKARLMAAGQRPINNVVDITNYVMLLTGQPLHAFDLDRVAGGRLVVRRARAGEEVVTLDDVVRRLDSDMVVIEDAQGPTSIAGVMGGNRSEVHDGTTRVLMEVATWIGPNVNRTSGRLNLRTEASARFEKQLSPEQAMEAQAVAAQLMIELCGARAVGGTIDVDHRTDRETPIVHLRDEKVERLLGQAVPRDRCAEILAALGFGVSPTSDGLDAEVPHWRRADVYREADLIEEIARIDGLDRLPSTLPSRRGAVGVLSAEQRLRRRAEDALVGCGLHEIVGWSFTSPDEPARLGLDGADRRARPIALLNPMSEDQSVMRTTLLGSLLAAARHNAARGMPDLGLFEVGAVYLPLDGPPTERNGHWAPRGETPGVLQREKLPDEQRHLGALLAGALRPPNWREARPPRADFFAAKGVLEAVGRALRVPMAFEPATQRFLHPGRAARVLAGGRPAGWLGELHPAVAARWDLDTVGAFEVDLDVLAAVAEISPLYRDLTSFPAVRQDIAVVVGDDVPAAAVLAAVRDAAGPTLRSAEVFDLYRGDQVGEGRVSLALHLEFAASDRTLTDEDVAARRENIVRVLREKLGGELRG